VSGVWFCECSARTTVRAVAAGHPGTPGTALRGKWWSGASGGVSEVNPSARGAIESAKVNLIGSNPWLTRVFRLRISALKIAQSQPPIILNLVTVLERIIGNAMRSSNHTICYL